MLPSPTNLSHQERAVLSRASEQVEQACERPWIAAMRNRIEARAWAPTKSEAA